MDDVDIQIRGLTELEEFGQVVRIQKAVWGMEDIDITPAHHFDISVKTGAILLGAFVGEELAGYVYSFPARSRSGWAQHSRQLGVLPRFRGKCIGRKLKWAQRKDAIEKGYSLITWTVDPLLSLNGRLNFFTLGAVTRTYLADFYRAMPALSVAPGVPADRLYLEWHLNSRRVEQCLADGRSRTAESFRQALVRADGGWPQPPGIPNLHLEDKILAVEIPRDIGRMTDNLSLVLAWQRAVRQTLEHYFSQGYWIDDFSQAGDRSYFILRLPEKGEWDGT